MYFLRIRDAVAEDFPALRASLGESRFDEVLRAYLAQHPTRDPSLRDAGRHLAGFLAANPALAGEPWQADLARFEWAMVESFDAVDEEVLTREALDALPPARWVELELRATRAVVVLHSDHALDSIRDGLLRDGTPTAGGDGPIDLRVWRQGFTVFHRRMDATEAAALPLVAGGIPFAELCERLAERDESDAAANALRLLRIWIDDELLVRPAGPSDLPSLRPDGR
jgi:hypothetical protein